LIFAHELGHNFGADHSFEDGQGNTGGIMDYGDGYLNGVQQFTTKYRKGEMCGVMKDRVGKCQGKFEVAANQDPSPVTPVSPNPGPTPGLWQRFIDFFRWLWCKISSGCKGECSGEEAADSQSDRTTASGGIVSKSEVFRGHLVHPGPHWGWAVASSAGLGFGLLMKATFGLKQALRIYSFQTSRTSPSPRRATDDADDDCEQSLLVQ